LAYHLLLRTENKAKGLELLELVGLSDAKGKGIHQRAEEKPEISYGDQRRLEIARALAPILHFSEPAAGMNPTKSTSCLSLSENPHPVQPDCDLN